MTDDGFRETLGRGMFPKTGWLSEYVPYAETQTDAPPVYHLASGLAVIAATMGNRSWLDMYGGKVFPATWNVLLGASSYMRKSTSMRIGVKLLEGLEGADDREEHTNRSRGIVLPEPGSKEGLEETMQVRADGILVSYEFGELLAILGRDHLAGTKEMLTRWYDGDSSTRATKKDQTRSVKEPAVTILGASTPSWLEDRAKEGDVRGGFLARFLWWPASMADKNEWMDPLENRQNRVTHHLLINLLASIRNLYKGGFQIEDAARVRFRDWLRGHEEGYTAEDFPPQLMGYHARLPTSVLKMAMCLEAAQGGRGMTIHEDSLAQALNIGVWLKKQIAALFTEELVFTPEASKQRQFLEAVGANGGIGRRDLFRKLRWEVRQFDAVANGLEEAGKIAIRREPPAAGGHQVVHYLRIV